MIEIPAPPLLGSGLVCRTFDYPLGVEDTVGGDPLEFGQRLMEVPVPADRQYVAADQSNLPSVKALFPKHIRHGVQHVRAHPYLIDGDTLRVVVRDVNYQLRWTSNRQKENRMGTSQSGMLSGTNGNDE